MAQNPPPSVDVTDIQFKVHDRFSVFNAVDKLRSSVNLLTAASNYGLMFVGNPNEAELKVVLIKDLVESKTSGRGLHARQVQLPNLPNCIAVSSDGSMLAVNYTQNGCGFVIIYSVPSFTTSNIKSLHNIRLPGDENISALQLLWNPVVSGSLAVVMSNGALGMYDFKNNSYEFHTLDSKEQITCGSWSPKGKQIVLGFPNGKLAQYKPDLKLARTIVCPPNIHPGPFDTISIQWLSTFQFAVVFLQKSEESTPSLYIVHAPKAGNPTYTNYYDICYSSTGPRAQQVNLTHIPQWNLLLVTSANGVEIGILGTKETTEAPTWIQYTLLDEARIEMPLTEDKDETYPIGFALDTSSTHSLTIAEKKMPVMPMIHVLSTHGQLVSFNFLNLQPNTPDICSPPPPPSDTSGMSQFKPVSDMLNQRKSEITIPAASLGLSAGNQSAPIELPFPSLGMTSTPALEKPKAIFGTPTTGSNMFGAAPASGFSFSSQPAAPVATTSGPSFFRNNTLQQPTQQATGIGEIKKQSDQQPPSAVAPINNQDKSKPLYTVPSTFTPPAVTAPTGQSQSSQQQQIKIPQINANEVDDIVNKMIILQITSFDMELKKLANLSKGLLNNIGSTDEMKTCSKRLNDLQEIIDQADDKEFESDLQGLRNLLNETYAMVAECRSKLNMYNNPDIARLKTTSSCNPINRRQLAKLQSYLANNQAQLQIINNQIDAQWSNFQDVVRRNSKTQMHTPCLEGIYQRMTRLKDMIARERVKLNFIKSKLKEKGLLTSQLRNSTKPEVTMESLTDTILSMSLAPSVEQSRSKLTKEKLDVIRERLENRKITIIRPQRPDRVGLNSEVILETKLKSDRKIRDGAATNMDKMEQERIKSEQQRVLTKPTATKAVASSMPTISQPNMSSMSQPNAPATFGFGGVSSFVKPNAGKPDEFKKEQQHQQPAIVKPVASTAGPMFLKSTPSTTAMPSGFGGFGAGSNSPAGFPGLTITPTTVPAFSGFGTNKPITFGAPKPLIPNAPAVEVPSNNDNAAKDQSAPIGFSSKPSVSENKPFSMSSFSSPFAAVAPSKPQTTADVGDKENKTPDTQSFMPVATKSENTPVASSAPTLSFGSTTISSQGQSGGFSFGLGNAATLTKTTSAPAAGPFAFSFSSALNSGTDTTTTVTKPLFGGLAKATTGAITITPKPDAGSETAGTTHVKTEAVESTADSAGSLNLGTLGLPATPNLSPTPAASTTQSSNTLSTAQDKAVSTSTTDPTDSLFGGLNICKPLGTENGAFKPAFGGGGNIFGSTSFASTDTATESKSLFEASAASKEQPAFTGFGTAANTTKPAFETTSATSTTTPAVTSVTTTTATSVFAPKVTQSFSFGLAASTTGAGSIATGQAAQTTSAPSIFSSLAATSTFGGTSTATTTVATSSATGAPMFAGLSFGTPTSQPTSSIFGATATAASTTPSSVVSSSMPQFLNTSTTNTAMPAASPFGAAATSAGSLFSSVVATTTPAVSTGSGNIFGGIPKPDQSVFGQSDTNVFGSPTADTATSGGSLFGGQTSAFGAQPSANTGGSIFGGGAPAAPAFGSNNGGNIFASANTNAAPNVFAAAAQPTGAASGGSIFDQSAASGQSGGALFGGAGSGFGTPSSPFGAAASSGGSIFGGSATSPKPSSFGSPAPSAFGSAGTGGFGMFSQTQAFGSPTQGNTGGGSFAQGGSSIAQTGFGSPGGATAFTKPVFGAAPSFGGAPTFGSPPSFGAAAGFGSPKGFGSFAAPNASGGAFTSPTQKNNLFEALGSSDTGLSFGNLAQNTNANQQKPAFGGSSFMSYRS